MGRPMPQCLDAWQGPIQVWLGAHTSRLFLLGNAQEYQATKVATQEAERSLSRLGISVCEISEALYCNPAIECGGSYRDVG